ncbi:MAG: hypothetical protein KDA81_16460 [Planctomycetaceae bacterium]|nr:hypothetical protein [Planctomycetaceae bacterium]
MAWGCLVANAFILWNVRQTGALQAASTETVAILLAAFAALVSVFAWMLFNPETRSAAESPTLFLAAAATLFPPPVIGFCLMPPDSSLRWWLALCLFLLCAIAVLSHVPDEFFGVPRALTTYLHPLPAFDQVEDSVMDPDAAWFRFEDLSRVVADEQRPSMAPRAYLNQETTRPRASRADVRPMSSVDEILGTNFDLGLLDDYTGEDLSSRQSPTSRDRRINWPEDRRSVASPPSTSTGLSDRSTSPPKSSTVAVRPHVDRVEQPAVAPVTSLRQPALQAERFAEYERRQEQQRRSEPAKPGNLSGLFRYPDMDADPAKSTETADVTSAKIEESRSTTHRAATSVPQTSYPSSPIRRTAAESPSSLTSAVASPPRSVVSAAETGFRFEGPTLPTRPGTSTVAKAATATAAGLASGALAASQIGSLASKSGSASPSVSTDFNDDLMAQAFSHLLETPAPPAVPERRSEATVPAPHRGPDRPQRSSPSPTAESRPTSTSALNNSSDVVSTPKSRHIQGPPEQLRPATRRSRYDDESQNVSPPSPVMDSRTSHDRMPVSTTASAPSLRSEEAPARSTAAEVTSAPERQRQSAKGPEFHRTKESDGSELIEGTMKVRFEPGQKRANLHIPFSPPLAGVPDVECECVGGEDLRLKVPVRQSYGVRIEARRTDAEGPLEADIGFAAFYAAK